MKLVVFSALAVAVFIQADGRAVGKSGVDDVEKKFALVEERVAGLAEVKYEAERQLNEYTEFLEHFGVDIDSLESLSEDQLKKINEQAKEVGLDLDAMKRKLRNQAKELKDKAKKLGFDENELPVLKSGMQLFDLEAIKKWAEEQYTKIKDALIELDKKDVIEGLFQKFEKKAKEVYNKFEEKVKKVYKKAERKVKSAFENFWSKITKLG